MQTQNMDRLMQHEELIISAASKTSVTGAAAGVVGTVSQVDILTLTGVLIAVAGFGVNLFFNWRRDRREHREHLARMESIRNNCDARRD